jgi:hypothetical protein
MSQSTISKLADAVVGSINGADLSHDFTAVRTYLPVFDLAQMKDLHVTVVPKAVTSEAGDRSRGQFDYEIDVAVQKKLQTTENDEIDELMGLVEEIADIFRSKRLEGYTSAICVKTENEPVYAQEHLDQLRQFTSVLTLTFRLMR